MAILAQTVKQKSVKWFQIDASTADLVALEGEVTKYDEKSSGGTASAYPATLNRKKFSCGDKDTHVSCSFTIPHVKETAYISDIEAVVIGAFDASFDSSVTADYTNLLYDRS